MSKNNMSLAEAYYTAVAERDFAEVEKYLHPDVQFIAPLAKMKGKEAVMEATKQFASFFKSLKIRAKLDAGDQAVIVYDLECPVGDLSAAVLLTFQEGLVSKLELFYDARPFEKR